MSAEQFTKISFYVVAHADDWQLFMQPNAFNDLVDPARKVVYVVTTAGDAGAGERFWAAREEGTKSSLRFRLAPLAAIFESAGTCEFNQHIINYWSMNDVTCYFLRLPDGNLDGNGFSSQDYQSLSKLKAGHINTITAVDQSTTYHGWPDFQRTVEAIILTESKTIPDIWINYINPDTGINPNDHADHIATGDAIQPVVVNRGFRRSLYVGYSVSNQPENLKGADLFWKAGMFAAYEKAVFDGCGYGTLREGIDTYIGWCRRNATFTTQS